MKLNTFVKVLNKSSAKAASDYLKDREHEQHRETIIPEELNFISPALASIDCDWSLIDEYEETYSHNNQHDSKIHAKQFDFILPKDAVQIENGNLIYSVDFLKKLSLELIDDFVEDTGFDPSKILYEAQIHINYEGGELNPHLSLLVSERTLETERKPKIYKKDIFQDKDGKLMKKEEALKLGIEPTHRKGEIMKDKDGHIRYEEGLNLTIKDREIKTSSFREKQKENARDIYSIFFPQHEFYVGKDPEIIPQKKWTPEMAHSHPEKAQALKDLNKQIQLLNKEIQEEPEPQKRKAFVKKISSEIDREIKKSNFEPLDFQIQIFDGIKDWLFDFRNQFRQYLDNLKNKLKDIYLGFPTINGSFDTIFKYKDRGDGTFSLWKGDGREYIFKDGWQKIDRIDTVSNLGVFEKTGDIKHDVEKATGFTPYDTGSEILELTFLNEEKEKKLINNFEKEINIQPQIEQRERHIERGFRM